MACIVACERLSRVFILVLCYLYTSLTSFSNVRHAVEAGHVDSKKMKFVATTSFSSCPIVQIIVSFYLLMTMFAVLNQCVKDEHSVSNAENRKTQCHHQQRRVSFLILDENVPEKREISWKFSIHELRQRTDLRIWRHAIESALPARQDHYISTGKDSNPVLYKKERVLFLPKDIVLLNTVHKSLSDENAKLATRWIWNEGLI